MPGVAELLERVDEPAPYYAMMDVLAAINAPLMIPMHYFGPTTLERFLAQARQRYPVEFSDKASIVLSRATLPRA